MATKRAMAHLQSLIELDARAETQLAGLAGTLKQVIEQMDAILEDADQPVSEVLTETTTGQEASFALKREPVKAGSVTLKLNSTVVAKAGYTVDGNVITPLVAILAGKTLTAQYVVLGMKSQTAEILLGMSDLTAAQFAAKKAKYQMVVQWIEANV